MNENGRTAGRLRGRLATAGVAGVLALGVAGCKSNTAAAPIVSGDAQNSGDPAAANLAQPYTGGDAGSYNAGNASTGQPTRVLGSSQSFAGQANGESYGYDSSQAAPIIRQAPAGGANYDGYGLGYSDAEEAGEQAIAETEQAPPPLPEYDQPPAPDPNYLWTPGYWNYASAGYYWVPGAWCAPPFYGALWTPPYWDYGGGHYLFHRGYWGPHVGFYGGVDYGFGYIGTGYYGGYWRGRDFVYNRAVTNVNINAIHNVYERPVVFDGRQYGPHPMDRVSYNGGRGGLNVQPRPDELAAMHEAHYAPVAAQREDRLAAATNRGQFFSANAGRPAQAFASRPLGSREGIAAAPQGQPFNRNGAGGAQPGLVNGGGRPGTAAAQPGFVGANRPGVQPGAQPFGAQRPGTQPGAPQPGATRPGATEPGSQRPGFTQQRPASQGNFGRPGTTTEPNRPGVTQPGTQGAFQRPGPQAQPARPAPQVRQQRTAPQVQQQRPAPQIQQQHAAPQVQQQRPAPQFQQRAAPQVEQQRAAPAFTPRPQAQAPQNRPQMAPRPAAPAPRSAPAPQARPAPAAAPHGGGDEHGHH